MTKQSALDSVNHRKQQGMIRFRDWWIRPEEKDKFKAAVDKVYDDLLFERLKAERDRS